MMNYGHCAPGNWRRVIWLSLLAIAGMAQDAIKTGYVHPGRRLRMVTRCAGVAAILWWATASIKDATKPIHEPIAVARIFYFIFIFYNIFIINE